jgi:hypothetical protein
MADEPKSTDKDSPATTHQTKPWVRWWWMGSAVDKANLTRELEQIASHGFGGVEITPLYGAVGFEDRYIDFLSPKYMEMLRFTCDEAKRLGLGVDMATGTGWPFGGPWITPENADAQIVPDPDKLIERPTRMKVKRAAPGDEGWVVDPFSATAMNAYLAPFDKAFADFPRDLIRCQFHDSFEYSGNWSHDLPEKFKEMHGYDLADHVKELWGKGDDDTNARVISDYRETLSELHLEYLKVWVKWSHDHGMLARNQAHGAPGNLLDLYAVADVSETETFGSTPFPIPGFRRDEDEIRQGANGPDPLIARFASSAAHVAGHPLASCETFTWLREHFKATMSEMKPEADAMFLAGINHLIYHGCCYSPDDATWPGWNFYASVEFNPRNTIWRDIPAMNAYITRVQSILQGGKPDNDILLYWPIFDLYDQPLANGKPNINFTVHNPFIDNTPFGKAADWLTKNGYSFDYISDAQLQSREKLDPYKIVVVPKCEKIPVETIQKLASLAQGGVTVVFEDQLPTDVPGLGDLRNRQAAMKASLEKLQGHARVGKLEDVLKDTGASHEAMVVSGLQFIRRATDSGHDYFIANLTGKPIEGWFPLSVSDSSIEILDPLTSASGLAATRRGASSSSEVLLQLQPGESRILRTSNKPLTTSPWTYLTPGTDPIAIQGTWHVDFIDGGPKLPASFDTDKLASWTNRDDEDTKTFAGAARYTIEFDAPTTTADDWMLDLGDVRESARVTINGQTVGTLWSLPFQTRVGSFIKPGKNKLEIEVTNLGANRIRDLDRRKVEWKKFHEINYVNIDYRAFDASNWPLMDSGLLGPVKLVPMKKTDLAAEAQRAQR